MKIATAFLSLFASSAAAAVDVQKQAAGSATGASNAKEVCTVSDSEAVVWLC